MILTRGSIVPSGNLAQFSWSSLRQFQNVVEVQQQLISLHNIPKKHHPNARKQAEQIRFCLIQAKEYADAAKAVSLATQPTLLYYSIMSLALAEVLLKQAGDSSLDKARNSHKHHGLLFGVKSSSSAHDLGVLAAQLVAIPHINDSKRIGTFELWHNSAREVPLIGRIDTHLLTGGSQFGYEAILGPKDIRQRILAIDGLNLFECMRLSPCMYNFLGLRNIVPLTIRGWIKLVRDLRNKSDTYQIMIHPGSPDVCAEFYQNFFVEASAVNTIDATEIGSGMYCHWTQSENNLFGLDVPPGSMWNKEEVRFWTSPQPLNEFGLFYIGLFILGNYARYYPDMWLRHIEQADSLALASEEFIVHATQRIPLLALSELHRTYFVLES